MIVAAARRDVRKGRSGAHAADGAVHREPFGEAGMQSSEQVVNRILDLDQRAERVRSSAREEAETIRRDAADRAVEERKELDRRIAGRIAEIEAEAAKTRAGEIAAVTADFENQANAVSGISAEKKTGATDTVVAKIREMAS